MSQTSATPSNAAVSTDTGKVFVLTAGDKGFIQNLSTAPLYVRFGEDDAAADAFSFILKAGDAEDDANGGYVEIDDYVGRVTVYSTDPRYIAWVLTE